MANTRGIIVDAKDFGLASAASDEARRLALQKAIDAVAAAGRGDVYVQDGTYTIGRNTTFGYCLLLKSGVRIIGESRDGVILKEAAGIAASVRLFYATGAVNASLEDLTLDGNKSTQSVNEHRHGIFIDGAVGLTLKNVKAQNFTGDGFYIYTDTEDLTLKGCTATLNDRSGVTFGRECSDVLVKDCTLQDNAAQDIDFEPGATDHIRGVRILSNTIGSPSDTGYSLTIGGTASTGLTDDVTVQGNVINGAVFIVWATNVVFTRNTVNTCNGNEPCVKVYRNCSEIDISHNELNLTRTFNSSDEHVGVNIDSTGVGNQPDKVSVRHNAITLSHPNLGGPTIGVLVRGALNVTIEDNTITGAGGTAGAGFDGGILLRASVSGERYVVRRNVIRNIGTVGVKVYGTENFDSVDISYNDIADTQAVRTMTTGISLDDGNDIARALTCIRNVLDEGFTTKIVWPTDVAVLTDYTASGKPVYTTPLAPEGFITAPVGSIALLLAAGVITATYKRLAGVSPQWVLQ